MEEKRRVCDLEKNKGGFIVRKAIHIALLITLVVSLCLVSNTGLAANKIIIKVAHANSIAPGSNGLHEEAVAFANAVNAKSHGRIEVQVHGAGVLGGEREIMEAVKSGIIESGIGSGTLTNFFPEAMVTDIPYLFLNTKIVWDVLDGRFGNKLSERLLKQTGMRNLGFGEVGYRHFTNSRRPIHFPKDLQGLKVRVQETPFYLTLIKSLGGSPTPVAWPETYSALQTGVVDAQENPVAAMVFGKIYEVQKYCTLDGHVYGVSWFLMNEKFFKSLPSDLKDIILDSAKVACLEGRRVQSLLSEQGVQTLIDHGVEVYTPTTAELNEFRKVTQKPCIDWMKTKIDPKLIDDALKFVKASEAKFLEKK